MKKIATHLSEKVCELKCQPELKYFNIKQSLSRFFLEHADFRISITSKIVDRWQFAIETINYHIRKRKG